MADLAPTPPDRRWDLAPLLGDDDPPTIDAAIDAIVVALDALERRYDALGVAVGASTDTAAGTDVAASDVADLVDAHNAVLDQLRVVSALLHGKISVDSRDAHAAAARSRLAARSTVLGRLTTRRDAWLATLDLDALAAASPTVDAHRYALGRAAEAATHQMGAEAEALAGELRLTGSVAWANLHRDLSAQLTGSLDLPGEAPSVVAVSALRAMASDPDPHRRAAAHHAEVAAWASMAHPLAATLNGAFGERIVLDRRRGWSDHRAPALVANGIDAGVLDAMLGAVDGALDDLRRYLRAKARLLGHDDALPWWDLAAPVGTVGRRSWPEAVTEVTAAFATFGDDLAQLAQRAVDERWIDVDPRPGKVGGAFCMGVGGGRSRVLINFDDADTGMLTLAHELGHAYHQMRLADRTPLQRQTPMTLAETASVFCETITLDAAMRAAAPDDELGLLELDLRGATQIVVDIRSRIWFEEALLEARTDGTVAPEELCALLGTAQQRAYGDAIAAGTAHPYLWAVKGHYFTPFYNWPYTFGLLFALGLYDRYRDDPVGVRRRYDTLLADTGMAAPAELAGRFGIDIGDAASWERSLDVLRGRVDRFVALSGG
ncbi:MAG: M3 family metallopeptidase [Acidimicrobiales bacterium]